MSPLWVFTGCDSPVNNRAWNQFEYWHPTKSITHMISLPRCLPSAHSFVFYFSFYFYPFQIFKLFFKLLSFTKMQTFPAWRTMKFPATLGSYQFCSFWWSVMWSRGPWSLPATGTQTKERLWGALPPVQVESFLSKEPKTQRELTLLD